MSARFIRYTLDGIKLTHDIGFGVTDGDGFDVYINRNKLDKGLDYDVIGSVEELREGDGKITIKAAHAASDVLLILSDTLARRVTNFAKAARFEEAEIDNEFDNLLRLLEDASLYLTSTPYFNPVDIGLVDGQLPPVIPKGVLRINEQKNGFELVELDKLPEFIEALRKCTEQADRSELEAEKSEASAREAQGIADSIGQYRGLWPSTGGSAKKGDTWQAQESGSPAGRYYTALKDTVINPISDNINWKLEINEKTLASYVEVVYSSVSDMVAGVGIGVKLGDSCKTEFYNLPISSEWMIVSSISSGDYGVPLNSGLYAKLTSTDGNILHYGAAPYMPPSVASRVNSRPAIEAALAHVGFFTTPKGGRWLCDGSITVTRGMRLQGLGCLPEGVYTDLIFKLAVGEDSFVYSDGGNGYPQGDVKIYDLCITNEVVDDLSQFPDPANVINGKNRAWWSVNDQPFVDGTTWIEKKTGGANCPHLDIKNVMLRYFFIGCDTHSWMSNIQNLQTRYCGVGLRIYGTSTNVTSFWPQYPLIAGAQVRLEYSELSSISAGEQSVTGYTENVYGIELHGGQCTVSAMGMELACKAQYLVYNGRYRIENNWSSTKDGFKPLYIFDIAAYPDLTIAGGFDYRTYENSYMRTNRLDNIDGIKHENPIYPWFLSSVDTQFNTLTKVTEDGGVKYRGIFGKALSQVGETQLLPYSRTNRALNAGVAEEGNSKAEYVANFDSTLKQSALVGYRVLYDTSGYTTGDKFSGTCTIVPEVGIASDGTISRYPQSLPKLICNWSGVKTSSGYELYISDLGGDFTTSISMGGSGGTEAIVVISAIDPSMTLPQKEASECRFITDARCTAPAGTKRDYIITVASS